MANQNRVNFQIGFTVDKSGLEQMQSLFQQIANKAQEPGNKLDVGLQKAGKTAQTLDGILEKTFNTDLGSLNVTKFNQEMSKAGLTLKGVKADLSKAGSQGATAFNRLSQSILGTNMQLKQSNQSLDRMFTTFKNTIRYGISSSIFNNVVGAIEKAYSYSRDLNSSLNDIRIVTDKSAESMEKFAADANKAAKALGASTLDYTNASLIYYQQGLSDEETKARTETTLKAANITGQSAAEVSEQLTAVWNGYKVTAEETEAYVDKLAAVAATTAADLEELSIGMSKVASAANTMGVDFDDLNAQIATIVSVTRQAPESVGTALKTIYARLGDLKVDGVDEFGVKLGEVSGQLQTMGIQILDQKGNMRDMTSVMAEVADKWKDQTDAQRQAAAVAMAGKRQYNNLIALFENWDMYSGALETSANALGTLQHQQDIYMESTEAKLQKLKTTWQELYGDLLDTDELQRGISGLTDLVTVFDSFIKSFGGGTNAIMGFGAIFANIFNKQIVQSINDAIQRQDVFKHNLELAKLNSEVRAAGVTEAGPNASIKDIAAAENSKIQYEYAEKIYQIRAGLNQEQYNTLNNYQKEIGLLTEEETILKNQLDISKLKTLGDRETEIILHGSLADFTAIDDAYGKALIETEAQKESVTAITQEVKKLVIDNKEYKDIESEITKLAKELVDYDYEDLQNLIKKKNVDSDYKQTKKEILESILQIERAEQNNVNAIKKEANAAAEVYEKREKIAQLQERKNNIAQQADDMLKLGTNAKKTAQNITVLTTGLGSLASVMSSISSLKRAQDMDSDISMSERITQTLMTISMLAPSAIATINNLTTAFEGYFSTSEAVKEANNAVAASTEAVTTATGFSVTAKEKAIIVDNLSQIATEKRAAAEAAFGQIRHHDTQTKLKDIASEMVAEKTREELLDKTAIKEQLNAQFLNMSKKKREEKVNAVMLEIDALIAETDVEDANSLAVTQNTIQQETNNKVKEKSIALNALLKSSLIGIAVVLAIVGAAIISVTKAEMERQEAARKARAEEEKAYQELHNARRKEIVENQELLQSQMDLYQQYKNGNAAKDDVISKTKELAEVLGKEAAAVAVLTGNYDALQEEAQKKRNDEIQKKLDQDQLEITESAEKISQNGEKNKINIDRDIALEDAIKNNPELGKYFEVLNPNDARTTTTLSLKFDPEDAQNIGELEKIYHQLMNTASSDERKNELFNQQQNNLMPYTTRSARLIEEDKIDRIELETAQNHNLSNIEDYSEYAAIVDEVEEKLIAAGKYAEKSSESYEGAIEFVKGLSGNNEKYETRALATNYLNNKYGTTFGKGIDVTDFANQLSNKDLNALISGKVVIDSKTTEEDIKKQINVINKELEEDSSLGIVVSLRSKLTSGKKLTKSELKEAMGEESDLEEKYIKEFSDFENQSELEQIKNMNAVADAEIANNNKKLQSAKENAKEELDYYKKLEAEKEEISKRTQINGGTALAAEDKERLEEINQILSDSTDTINKLKDISENGLGFEEIDSTIFDNLIAGIDGVITEANVLKSLAEDIGENQTIAADDIERFGKNFPEIVENAENYKFLQDGSLQLTKEGQVALQDIVNTQKEEIKGKYEAYRAEVEKNAEMHKASAEYYNSQAEALDAYLNGQADAADTVAKLNKNTADYKEKLVEAEVKDDANAKKSMMDNIATQTNDVLAKTESQYEYQCSVGNTIEAVAEAMTSGKFEPPAGPSGSVSSESGSISEEFYGSTEEVDEFESMSREQLEKLRDYYKQRYQEELNKYSTEESKLMGIDAAIKAANNAMDKAASGKGGKASKSGSSSKDKDKDKKEYEDEFDRYWEIKKAIDAVDRSISRLEKDQQNLHGKELIASLKQENELIKQQSANYEKLYEMQKQEAEELRAQLSTMGLAFDANGAITNYAAATSAALAQYIAAIEQYNAGLIDETTLKVFEKSYENFKKLLERYDKLYYTEMQDTQDKLDDMRRKELANNLKAWEVEIQLRLDTTKAQRDWNDFLKDIEQDFRKVQSDLTIDSSYDRDNFKEYMKDVNTTLKAIKDVEAEIEKMKNGGQSDMFESISQAQEKLKELQEQLLEQGKSLYELYKAIWNNYIDGMDQVKDKFDELMKRYKHLDNELKFQKELIELIYGDKAYDLMDKYYTTQEHNIEAQIDSLRQQADFWQEQFNKSYELAQKTGAEVDLDDWTTQTEDMQKAYDNMIQSQEDLNDLVLEAVKILQDKYLNTINKIMDTMDESIWGKGGFDEMKSNQDFMQKKADAFLDDVQGAYKIQSLALKIDQEIAKTTNTKNQQKLQTLREHEIDMLREKKDLTQADVDLSEARLQIALKEMALEDAQNNKTSMKLTRNEQGNQSYQYVADEDDVAAKEQDLNDAYGNLYELANNSYQDSMELVMDLYEEMKEKMIEIASDTTLTEEEKNQKLLEIQEQYRPLMEAAAGNAEIYRQEAMIATSAIFGNLCRQDETAYDKLTALQKRLVDEFKNTAAGDYDTLRTGIINGFYPDLKDAAEKAFSSTNVNSQTTAAQMIKTWSTNKDSVKQIMLEAIKKISDATAQYQKDLDKLQEVAGIDFKKIGDAIDDVDKKINDMNTDTEKLANDSDKYLDELRKLLEEVAMAWKEVSEKIKNAKTDMEDYTKAVEEAKKAEEQLHNIPNSNSGGPSNDSGGPSNDPNKGNEEKHNQRIQDRITGTVYATSSKKMTESEAQTQFNDFIKNNAPGSGSKHELPPTAQPEKYSFRSGGYTGEQADDRGRLAVLHQKELVLNADDTKNFLNGITTLRDLTSLNGSISNSIAAAIGGMALSLAGINPGTGVSGAAPAANNTNTYNITAEFPNAYSAEEIKQAILTLPNYASQYINRNAM